MYSVETGALFSEPSRPIGRHGGSGRTHTTRTSMRWNTYRAVMACETPGPTYRVQNVRYPIVCHPQPS